MKNLRTTLLTVAPPLAVAAVSIGVLLMLDLPDRIAVHWGPDGVDRLGGIGDLIAPIAVFVPIATAVMFAFLVFGSATPRASWFGRFVVATSVFVGSSVSLVLVSTALVQVGATDVTTVSIGASLAAAGGAMLLAAALAVGFAALAPLVPIPAREPDDAPSLALAPTERVSWSHSVGPAPAAITVLAAAVLIVILALAFAGAPLPLTLAVVVLLVAVGGFLFWRVTVDARGLTVRSVFGYPRFRMPPATVVDARAISVSPLRQFGGWGIRIGVLGWGVVVRGGTAIEVTRPGKSPFIVTVDDAATGAALLTTLARANHPST